MRMSDENKQIIADYKHIVGQTYNFEDGSYIRVTDLREREAGVSVLCEISHMGSMSRRAVFLLNEFIEHYKHLFNFDKGEE